MMIIFILVLLEINVMTLCTLHQEVIINLL